MVRWGVGCHEGVEREIDGGQTERGKGAVGRYRVVIWLSERGGEVCDDRSRRGKRNDFFFQAEDGIRD